MKSTGKALLAGLALCLAGCGGPPYAPANPLAASTAPALTSACNSRFSFEDGGLANWNWANYGLGFISMDNDGIQAFCGTHALHIKMDLGGATSKTVVITNYFNQFETLSGATRTLHIYFPQAPPTTVGLQAVFLDKALNWAQPGDFRKSSFAAGWNSMSGGISNPAVEGFLMQFDNNGAPDWSGEVWVDEINW
jgi:hypothetical protein